MSTAAPHADMNAAIVVARDREDIAVGNEVIRHRRSSRLMHWTVAVTFFVCLFTGLPLWAPIFAWMGAFFGGLSVCRVLHPWAGVAFFVASGWMFFHWLRGMRLLPEERGWLGPKALTYLRYQSDIPDVGKYNGGQKLFFWAVSLGAVGLLISGLLMWFPLLFPVVIREAAFIIHDITFILFTVGVIGHMYLGTAAEPGTFGSMTRGTVTRRWARLHHPGWYRDVTRGDGSPRS